MKKFIIIFLILFSGVSPGIYGIKPAYAEQNKGVLNMNIQIEDNIFKVNLEDNETARVLVNKLPMTINMLELNGNEKYYYLSDRLPAVPKKVENIKNGDIMLFGDNCLVIFYKDFKTSYSYTKIGHIENSYNLGVLLGKGNVKVMLNAN